MFIAEIKEGIPAGLALRYLESKSAHIFSCESAYKQFQAKVTTRLPSSEKVAVVGSANWRFSLNPEKAFREFGEHSDVDVAIVSRTMYSELWEEMRSEHRRHFYQLGHDQRKRLRRNAENVYSGFISPDWIPNRDKRKTFQYKNILNQLSDASVGYLKVKMLFFKNLDEAVDYYARGFVLAKSAKRATP